MSRRLGLFPLIFLIGLALGAAPQASYAAKNNSQTKLKKIENEVEARKKKAAVLEQQGKATASTLHDLQQKLVNATKALQTKEDEQQQVEDRLYGLEREITAKNEELAKSRHELGVLTGALIRISQQPPEAYFLRAGLTSEHIHRAILARALLPRLTAESESAARDIAVLSDLRWMAKEQKRLVAAAQQNLKLQRSNLDQLVETRQGLLNRTEEQKAEIARQLVSLTNEARDLRQLLARVAPPGFRPRGEQAIFHPLLERPVTGSIVRVFGTKDADGITSHGLTFKSSPGSPVVAPAAGRVVFAGPFRGYGQILILQHKGGYHSFLSGFGRIDAEMGQDVMAGEPLGILPVKTTAEKPELYFEWRRNGEPVDPLKEKFRVQPALP